MIEFWWGSSNLWKFYLKIKILFQLDDTVDLNQKGKGFTPAMKGLHFHRSH